MRASEEIKFDLSPKHNFLSGDNRQVFPFPCHTSTENKRIFRHHYEISTTVPGDFQLFSKS